MKAIWDLEEKIVDVRKKYDALMDRYRLCQDKDSFDYKSFNALAISIDDACELLEKGLKGEF